MCQKNLKDEDLVNKARNYRPSDWQDIQTLIDIAEDIRIKIKLEKIMVTKFHEEEAINDSL